jgi:hypothetical protein
VSVIVLIEGGMYSIMCMYKKRLRVDSISGLALGARVGKELLREYGIVLEYTIL